MTFGLVAPVERGAKKVRTTSNRSIPDPKKRRTSREGKVWNFIFGFRRYSFAMQRVIPFLVFFVVLGLSRVIGALSPESWANLSPLGALFFCGMACFGLRGVILPAAVWVVTYPVTSLIQGYGMTAGLLTPLFGFACMVGLARFFRGGKGGTVFAGSLLSALLIYLVTNSLSWVVDPLYAPKSMATFGQALWTGLPGHAPTWMFFRNALVAQALFSALFLAAQYGIAGLPARRVQAAKS